MISQLKDNYYTHLAKGATLPFGEYSFRVPISTGSLLLDSCLVEKIRNSKGFRDHEHLLRSWRLFRKMRPEEEKILMDNLGDLLNDHKILLALILWLRKDDEACYHVLRRLPWGWRVQFPLVLIKPAYVFFQGWKKELPFRFVSEIDFPRLRELFTRILQDIGEPAILKYRRKLKASWALLKYRPDTGKEKALEDWCFHKGNNAGEIKLLGIYTEARDILTQGKEAAFIQYLLEQDETIPLTSFMGLLGNRKIDLQRHMDDRFRDYALNSASFVETVLRLREWSSWPKKGRAGLARIMNIFKGPYWLDREKAELISEKISKGVVTINLPFEKVMNAYLQCDSRVKRLLTRPLFLPLLKSFGESAGKVLPQSFNYVMPTNMIHLSDFLTYNVFNISSRGSMTLLGEEDHVFSFSVEELAPIIHRPVPEVEEYLLKTFGQLTDRYRFDFKPQRIARSLDRLDRSALLILNIPFFQDLDIMNQITSFDYVLNMNSYYGAPNEISLNSSFVPKLRIQTQGASYEVFGGRQQHSAYGLVNYIRMVNIFKKLEGEYGPHCQS